MSTRMFHTMILGAVVAAVPALADVLNDVPNEITHRGVIAVHGERFNGEGDFRFALVDRDTDAYLWNNDDDCVPAGCTSDPPTNAVVLTVVNGVYSVRLGDTTLANMTTIPRAIFNDHPKVALRIWFDDSVNGVHQLTPDQVITSAPYAQRLPNVIVDEATGNVGIGTADPVADLHVVGSLHLASTDRDISWQSGEVLQLGVFDGAQFHERMRITSDGDAGIGTMSPSEKLDVAGAVAATVFKGFGTTPIGGIITFFGDPATLPENWVMCDGRTISDPDSPLNGQQVPNMSGRVARGPTNGESVGQEGGRDEDGWSVDSHAHAISVAGAGVHQHTTDSAGHHQHETPLIWNEVSNWTAASPPWGLGGLTTQGVYYSTSGTSVTGWWALTSGAGGHSHTIGTSGSHTHTATASSAGAASGTIDTLPSYVALHYIIRIK